MSKKKFANLPYTRCFEVIIIFGMFITLIFQSRIASVSVWEDLPLSLFVRSAVWFLGILILPGLYAIRILGISQHFSRIARLVIAINLSFMFVSLASIIFYYIHLDYSQLPLVLLIITILFGCIYWWKSRDNIETQVLKVNRWHVILLFIVVVAVLIAFLIQINERYLIPGDNWLSLKPAISMISQTNFYESFKDIQYPPLFGFTLAGLAVCGGIPIVNAYVILFPVVSLNILGFFALIKTVFNLSDRINGLSCVLYGFGGGLGWLIQALLGGTQSFWTVSLLNQDMYFSVFFWSAIQFSYKSLAITLVFAALIVFMTGTKSENWRIRLSALSISALLILFSFMMHIIDALMIAPVILGISYLYQKGNRRFLDIGILIGITVFSAVIIDNLMYGFYSSLVIAKFQLLLSTINLVTLIFGLTLFAIIVSASFLVKQYFFASTKLHSVSVMNLHRLKFAIVIIIFVVYLAGLFVWPSISVSDLSAGFPWFRYVTRYGFIGGLAILGLMLVPWRHKRFFLLFFWALLSISVGSVWWGERTNGYLFPVIALLAAIVIDSIWIRVQNKTSRLIDVGGRSVTRFISSKLKIIVGIALIAIIALSLTSLIYGAYHYTFEEKGTEDDAVEVFSWIAQNTPPDSAIIVPENYTIWKGVYTIGNREIFRSDDFAKAMDPDSFMNFTQTIRANNIRYVVKSDSEVVTSDILENVIVYSKLVFQSGAIKVFEIPLLQPPSPEPVVAIINGERMGLKNSKEFGWVDDSFAQDWFYANANASSDGEVLTINWQFSAISPDPAIEKYISQVDSNRFPYFIIRYKNTVDTTVTPDNNVYQIITMRDQNDSRNFVKNIFLPITEMNEFTVVSYKLPANQSINSISLWMSNKQSSGMAEMQIDYLGFSYTDSVTMSENRLGFLSMALPAMWPVQYSFVNSFSDAKSAAIAVSLYDNDVPKIIQNATDINTFVFFNMTAIPPPWGSEWKQVSPGIICGSMEDKRIVIVNAGALQGDMAKMAENVYSAILKTT